MEHPGIAQNSVEGGNDEKNQSEIADTSTETTEKTEKDELKPTSDGTDKVNEKFFDSTTSVETPNPADGTAKGHEDSSGGKKSPANVEKGDHAKLRDDPSTPEMNKVPSKLREPSGTLDNDVTKSDKKKKSPIDFNKNNRKEESKSLDLIEKDDQFISMEVESPQAKERDQNVEESIKMQTETSNANSNTTTAYSTRGRSIEAAAVEEKPERVHVRDTFEESPRPKDQPSGVSFLDEAMTEEERKNRTRYIPGVEGMNMLRRNEIKEDVALATSLPSVVLPSGTLQTRYGRLGSPSGRSNDTMDVDGNEPTMAINDEIKTTIELPSSTLTIPSDAFVAPKGVIVGDTETSIEIKEVEPIVQSPSEVESVMSFNPPRPPESVGGKKKHRMTRWERRPEDIEVDMKNYRRTVQRTRQELQKSETEYERLEMIDAHLRHHLLNHCHLLDKEYNNLQNQLDVEVEKLIQESDLVGSRTRSRNLTKVDVVMRDVLTMLTRNEQKDVSMDGMVSEGSTSSEVFAGVGGLNSQAFTDWERSTKLESMNPCVSWIEPGQKVTTLYGEGTVIEVLPPESPPADDSSKNLRHENRKKIEEKKRSNNVIETNDENRKRDEVKNKYESLLPLRVKVRLRYGVGVFVANAIMKIESPAHLSDANLAKRWKGMIDSAIDVGPCIDLQGVLPSIENLDGRVRSNSEKQIKEISSSDKGVRSMSVTENATEKWNDGFLTVGASLVPTKFGRGNFLHNMKIRDIEETFQNVLYDGHGVLGRKSNPGVTNDFRKWEDEEQEYLNLRASVLQLKNALYRQRRIRVLNERTTTSMNDRYIRAEELVSEMRTDLKSLKRRLGDELKELGITDGKANQILSKFYKGNQEEDQGDVSTPKRLRRASSMIGEMLTDIDVGNHRRDGDSRDSMDDQGTDDLSGDDVEARRPTKKFRSSVSTRE